MYSDSNDRLGVLICGLGGAVATTAVAGIELLCKGDIGEDGLPLAGLDVPGLVPYRNIVFSGWDLSRDDLAKAAMRHRVLDAAQIGSTQNALAEIVPLAAVPAGDWCLGLSGDRTIAGNSFAAFARKVRRDIQDFKESARLERCVMVNLMSTERLPASNLADLESIESFEAALEANSAAISPAMVYAYAAISEGVPFANFTPSRAVDVPALIALAERERVPVAGKDGKTGQTFIKTVVAPALRARNLRIEGWYSTNILGNNDGLVLKNEASLASKIKTKADVLEQILGYPVSDHIVDIKYYRPRGDNKEAWDNIDIRGFLNQPMQIKVNFLCRDSILAAPLVIEIARLLDLARAGGEFGIQEQLGCFFKSPMTASGTPVHSFGTQHAALMSWLIDRSGAPVEGARQLTEVD
jgi:myo-inositol-1-phosphate synthase